MKIFSSDQIRAIDEFTIQNEPVASVDLMERAAWQLFKWLEAVINRTDRILIFSGPGNNGGDGLALSRILSDNRYDVEVHYVKFTDKTSEDWNVNEKRLKKEVTVSWNDIKGPGDFPLIAEGDIIIDAIFGSGLKRNVEGLAGDVIKFINGTRAKIISIDIPSGLFCDDNSSNNYKNVIKADYTLSFQFPKLSFIFPEHEQFVGKWSVLPIGLDSRVINSTQTPYSLLTKDYVAPLLRKRKKFDHKGNFGHGLLIAGSYGKMGAAFLSASASLRAGIGLITCHVPAGGMVIMQCTIPEAMLISDKSDEYVSEIGNTDQFTAIGIGPGLGKELETRKALKGLLETCKMPIVIDADALNIISLDKKLIDTFTSTTIITPHPKEFERLAGKTSSGYDKLMKQIDFSVKNRCIVVLKGANTTISTPDGRVFFNSTGNPGMATAGSGDVLTGIILSLLAQGYSSEHAAVLGVYIHGKAGDEAAKLSCHESVIASDIINNIGKAFNNIRNGEFDSITNL